MIILGNIIGMNKVDLFWRVYYLIRRVMVIASIIFCLIMALLRSQIATLLSNEPSVQEGLTEMIPYVAAVVFFTMSSRHV